MDERVDGKHLIRLDELGSDELLSDEAKTEIALAMRDAGERRRGYYPEHDDGPADPR